MLFAFIGLSNVNYEGEIDNYGGREDFYMVSDFFYKLESDGIIE